MCEACGGVVVYIFTGLYFTIFSGACGSMAKKCLGTFNRMIM